MFKLYPLCTAHHKKGTVLKGQLSVREMSNAPILTCILMGEPFILDSDASESEGRCCIRFNVK